MVLWFNIARKAINWYSYYKFTVVNIKCIIYIISQKVVFGDCNRFLFDTKSHWLWSNRSKLIQRSQWTSTIANSIFLYLHHRICLLYELFGTNFFIHVSKTTEVIVIEYFTVRTLLHDFIIVLLRLLENWMVCIDIKLVSFHFT